MPLKPRNDLSEVDRPNVLSIRISNDANSMLSTLKALSGKSAGAVVEEAIKAEFEYQRENHSKELEAAGKMIKAKGRKR